MLNNVQPCILCQQSPLRWPRTSSALPAEVAHPGGREPRKQALFSEAVATLFRLETFSSEAGKAIFFVTLYILRTQYTRITFGKAECAHMKGSSLQFCLLNQSCFKLPPRILLPSSGLYSNVQEAKRPSDEKTFPSYLSQRSVSPEGLRPSNRNVLPEKKPRSCSHQLRMSGGLQPLRCSEASPERKQSRSGKHICGRPTAPPTILFPPTAPDINYRACFLSH